MIWIDHVSECMITVRCPHNGSKRAISVRLSTTDVLQVCEAATPELRSGHACTADGADDGAKALRQRGCLAASAHSKGREEEASRRWLPA